MENNFYRLTKISLVLIYIVIIAGAFVRMTGSGMGCPDWPKCFGFYIPPTEKSQILFKPNSDYNKGQMIIYNQEELLVAKSDFKSDTSLNLNNWQIYDKHNVVAQRLAYGARRTVDEATLFVEVACQTHLDTWTGKYPQGRLRRGVA